MGIGSFTRQTPKIFGAILRHLALRFGARLTHKTDPHTFATASSRMFSPLRSQIIVDSLCVRRILRGRRGTQWGSFTGLPAFRLRRPTLCRARLSFCCCAYTRRFSADRPMQWHTAWSTGLEFAAKSLDRLFAFLHRINDAAVMMLNLECSRPISRSSGDLNATACRVATSCKIQRLTALTTAAAATAAVAAITAAEDLPGSRIDHAAAAVAATVTTITGAVSTMRNRDSETGRTGRATAITGTANAAGRTTRHLLLLLPTRPDDRLTVAIDV